MSSGEQKHKILSRSVLLLCVSGWTLCSGWFGFPCIKLSQFNPTRRMTSPTQHPLSAGIDDPAIIKSRAMKCCIWLCQRPWGSITPIADNLSGWCFFGPYGWEHQGFLSAPSQSICHAQSRLTAPCLGGTSRTACWARCVSQTGVPTCIPGVTLLTVIISSQPHSGHMCLDGRVCVCFEFCFICFSHTFIRTVIVKTLSFFWAYRALVVLVIIHILQALQCGFLEAAFDTQQRALILTR